MRSIILITFLVIFGKGLGAHPALENPQSFSRGQKIVGGDEVVPNSLPYQAGLFVTKPQGVYFCGGSLISTKFVLTAASCIEGATSIEVRLGAHSIFDTEATQVRKTSTKFNIHSQWDSVHLVNDIATIELPEAVTTTVNIGPVPLPSRADASETFVGEWGLISGWGRDSDSATSISPVLRSVEAIVISNVNCVLYYGTYVTGGHICTSGVDGVGSCGGDSGGPLVVDRHLAGIISFGSSGGCETGAPTAYTRITSYLDWIQNHSDLTIN